MRSTNSATNERHAASDRAPGCSRYAFGPMVARFSAEYPQISLDISVDCRTQGYRWRTVRCWYPSGDGISRNMIAVPIGGQFRVTTVASRIISPALRSPPTRRICGNIIASSIAGVRTGTAIPGSSAKADQQVDVAVEGSLAVNDPAFALRAGLDGLGVVQLPEMWDCAIRCRRQAGSTAGRLVPALDGLFPVLFERRHVPVKLRTLVDFFRKESSTPRTPTAGRLAP